MMDTMTKEIFEPQKINPQKFGLWISMASLIMMFGAFTSAYLVRQAAGNWLDFAIPNIFLVSTVILIVSSIALQISYNSFKKGIEKRYKLFLVIAFVLGIAFLVTQYNGWMTLFGWGVHFGVNPSASFFYVITGVHAAHLLAGLTTLVVAMIHAFSLDFNVSEFRRNRFQMVLQFWHFLGILWIYLYVFLLMIR